MRQTIGGAVSRVVFLIVLSILSACVGVVLLAMSVVVLPLPLAVSGGAFIISGAVLGAAAFVVDQLQSFNDAAKPKGAIAARKHRS